ncbi:protein kinase domain protein [Drechmeria coniospora]|uniref:Protein kinase domain protein n=1 Tax=Drechmeria coniospora TaxID=98403 RepID=A0A151GNZ2_DRECN|nr:protein kinase domain protein [Drechmeria coniospora]KYK58834.1 protein kinase domain protein [Drechmeria coniospora]
MRGITPYLRLYSYWQVGARSNKSPMPRYVTIKIPALDIDVSRETRYSKLINHANPTHEGLSFLRVPIDEFKLKAATGTHSCLVYEPMRETLFQLQHRLKRQRLALPLFKFFIYCLLQALDYLHTECRVIHTDIKDDNVMITIENDKVLEDFVAECLEEPHPKHVRSVDGREVYLSRGDFGPLRGAKLLPELADFNLCYPGLGDRRHLSPIQPHRYRAPEVFLGCPWSYSADIWNLGLVMWNLLEDANIFERPAGEDGEYDAHVHLAQMVSLLGDPPPALIAQERLMRDHQLKEPVTNSRGERYYNMNQYWGGPFFDDHGKIFRQDLIDEERSLADTVTEIGGDEKETFLDFASCMLQWIPDERKTAKELLKHPFFDSFYEERMNDKSG